MSKKYYLQIYHHSLSTGEEAGWVNINSLEFHPEIVQRLSELGLMEIRGELVRLDDVQNVHRILSLRRCLGLNLAGAAVVLELLNRIEKLQEENERLKRLF